MEKKMVIALALVLFVISSNTEGVQSSADDCYDACSTACVQSNTRLMQRCDRKCQIKCDPGLEADGHLG